MPPIENLSQIAHDPNLERILMQNFRQQNPLDTLEKPFSFDDYHLEDEEKQNLNTLLIACRGYMDEHAMTMITHAVSIALYAHQDQRRDSGEAYTNHCFLTALELAQRRLDWEIVAAGVIHDTAEDSDKYGHPVEDNFIQAVFGDYVYQLAMGARNAEWDITPEQLKTFPEYHSDMTPQEENDLYDKLTALKIFYQFSPEAPAGPGVLYIKLADRLHNMRTIKGKIGIDKQQKKARQTQDIFVPLAKIIGEDEWARELADRSFEVLDPEGYAEMAAIVAATTGQYQVSDDLPDYDQIQAALASWRESFDLGYLLDRRYFLSGSRISVRQPSLYEMYLLSRNKSLKHRYVGDDIFMDVTVFSPDANLANSPDKSNSVSENLENLSQTLAESGWQNYQNTALDPQISSKDDQIYLQNPQTQQNLRIRIVSDKYEPILSGSLRPLVQIQTNIGENDLAHRKLAMLRENFQIISQGQIPTVTEFLHYLSNLDGIRVFVKNTKKWYIVPAGTSEIQIAHLVFNLDVRYVMGIREDSSIAKNSIRINLTQFPHDGDSLEFDMIEPDDPLSPIALINWLDITTDPKVRTYIIGLINTYLQDFPENILIQQYFDEKRLPAIGEKLFLRRLGQKSIILLQPLQAFAKQQGFLSVEEFFCAYALNQLEPDTLQQAIEVVITSSQRIFPVDIYHFADHLTLSQRGRFMRLFQHICRQFGVKPIIDNLITYTDNLDEQQFFRIWLDAGIEPDKFKQTLTEWQRIQSGQQPFGRIPVRDLVTFETRHLWRHPETRSLARKLEQIDFGES